MGNNFHVAISSRAQDRKTTTFARSAENLVVDVGHRPLIVRSMDLIAATRRLPAGSGSGQTLIQVIGGTLSIAAAHQIWVWLSSGLRPVDHRDEAWLKRGLPSS